MVDLSNVTPVNDKSASKGTDGEATETLETVVVPAGPPPTNADRAAAKEAKDAAEKEAKDKADTAAAAAGEGEDDGDDDKDKDKAKGDLDTKVWGDTGDDVANSVLQTLQNSGVTTDDAKALLWDAVEAGDPSKVDRDKLVEKVGAANATLIMAGIENVTSRNNAKLAEVQTIASTAAGSGANWEKATAWARGNLTEGDLGDYRDMLDKGGKQAEYAATQIVAAYNADPKNTALSAGEKQTAPDAKAPSTAKGISRADYVKQLEALNRSGWNQSKANALRDQRALGKKQGL